MYIYFTISGSRVTFQEERSLICFSRSYSIVFLQFANALTVSLKISRNFSLPSLFLIHSPPLPLPNP